MAKPRLDARKERLLSLHRGRRTFQKNLHIILMNAAKLAAGAAHGIPHGTGEELRRAIRAKANRAEDQNEAAAKDRSDNLMDYVLTYTTEHIVTQSWDTSSLLGQLPFLPARRSGSRSPMGVRPAARHEEGRNGYPVASASLLPSGPGTKEQVGPRSSRPGRILSLSAGLTTEHSTEILLRAFFVWGIRCFQR